MVYLDNAAGTKPYKEVIEVISDVLTNHWGNASADYSFGHDAQMIIDDVTQQVADDFNCEFDEIIWTSGAVESNNLAILGVLKNKNMPFFTSVLEHASIQKIALENGNPTYTIKNDRYGFIDLTDLENKLKVANKPALVSITAANSEIGTIQPIKAIAEIVHKYNGIFHCDATQLIPERRIDVKAYDIDLMSVSGQKFHCVKGIGVLYVKNGVDIKPLILGSQQNGRRGGTYPTHLIAAFGKALEMTRSNCNNYIKDLRDKIVYDMKINNVYLNGPSLGMRRLKNNISITVNGVSAEALVAICDSQGICIAKGSACQSYNPVPSKALLAIGLTKEQALSTIRISLDEFNTEEEINYFIEIFPKIVKILRENS